MPTIVQFRRGTTAQNDAFTGEQGELSVDTSKTTLRVHDGSTAGGVELGKATTTNATVSAAGTNQATGTALTKDYNVCTTVASGTGVVLPTASAGRRIVIVNAGANQLNIYPASGASINALASNAAYTIASNGSIEFMADTTTHWYTINRINIYDSTGTLIN